MNTYQCRKCGEIMQLSCRPRSGGCTVGMFHNWIDLGEVEEDTEPESKDCPPDNCYPPVIISE